MVISATIGAAAHRDNPARLGHLIVHLAQSGGHFVCEGASNDHDVGLARTGTENDPETIEIITGSTCRMKEYEIEEKRGISSMSKRLSPKYGREDSSSGTFKATQLIQTTLLQISMQRMG